MSSIGTGDLRLTRDRRTNRAGGRRGELPLHGFVCHGGVCHGGGCHGRHGTAHQVAGIVRPAGHREHRPGGSPPRDLGDGLGILSVSRRLVQDRPIGEQTGDRRLVARRWGAGPARGRRSVSDDDRSGAISDWPAGGAEGGGWDGMSEGSESGSGPPFVGAGDSTTRVVVTGLSDRAASRLTVSGIDSARRSDPESLRPLLRGAPGSAAADVVPAEPDAWRCTGIAAATVGRVAPGLACGTTGLACGTTGPACGTTGLACGTTGPACGTTGLGCGTTGLGCGTTGLGTQRSTSTRATSPTVGRALSTGAGGATDGSAADAEGLTTGVGSSASRCRAIGCEATDPEDDRSTSRATVSG